MAEGRLPKITLKWMPKQKRERGRPKKNWIEGIRKAMNERNLNKGQWEDTKQWSLGECSENGRRKIAQNNTEVDAETKESTRKTEEKLDGRYKEGHE
jgi:hypothetical protein